MNASSPLGVLPGGSRPEKVARTREDICRRHHRESFQTRTLPTGLLAYDARA